MKRKIKETTSGSVAAVATGGPTIARGASIYGRTPKKSMFKGKVRETAVNEEELSEDDLIIVPGKKMIRKNGLIPRDQVRTDHEVSMARSDLVQSAKNAKAIFALIKDVSEDEGIPGWVQEKLIKASDYLNTVREYLEGQQVEAELAGSYGMKSCGCDSECDCGPDFRGMFESVMSKQGVAEGWKEKMGAAALVAGPVIGGIGISNVDNQPDRVVSVQGTEYVKRELPNDMSKVKMTTDDKGNRVYIWTVRQGMKPTFTYHYYAPVEQVKEQGVAEGYKEPTTAAGHAKMAAKIKKMLDDTLADRGDRHGNPDQQQLVRAYEYHTQKAKEKSQGVAEGSEQVYKVLAVDKSNALSEKVMLTVKAGSIEEVFERLAINDWYPFEINGVEVINGKRLKKGVAEGFSDVVKGVKRALKGKEHPDVVAARHAGRAMGHYNLGDIQAGDKESQRYAKTRDMHLKAKGVLEDTVDEKAVSKQQQKFFGMVHALQKGKPVKGASPKLKQAAADISKSDVKDFAKTRHSGLPSKVKKG